MVAAQRRVCRKVIFLAGAIAFMHLLLSSCESCRKRQSTAAGQPSLTPIKGVEFSGWCRDLAWRIPRSPNITALVAAPGSGNTWLRYLLQQATGIATGSIYSDVYLQDNGFPAESVADGSVLLVKTHEKYNKTMFNYTSAVMLVREPRDTILAAFNYIMAGHRRIALQEAFENNEVPHLVAGAQNWEDFIRKSLREWEDLHQSWLANFTGPMKIVLYEDLVNNTETTLRSVLDFMNYNVSQADMNCTLQRKEGIYHRGKMDFQPYRLGITEDITVVRNRIYKLIDMSLSNTATPLHPVRIATVPYRKH